MHLILTAILRRKRGGRRERGVWHPIFFGKKYGKLFVQGLVANTK